VPCLPKPCTVKYLVTNYLDISCVPRRSFFEMLLYFAEDEREKEKLQDFTSSEGQVSILESVIYIPPLPNKVPFFLSIVMA